MVESAGPPVPPETMNAWVKDWNAWMICRTRLKKMIGDSSGRVIDFDTQYLPDSITLPLLWLGLLLNLGGTYTELQSAVIGAAAGYLSLWSVYWAFKLATGKEGMGFGDFKLLAAIGAWMGWTILPIVILLSSLVGAVIGITLILATKRGRDVPIPFGPYLGTAGVIALFWGQSLNNLMWSRF